MKGSLKILLHYRNLPHHEVHPLCPSRKDTHESLVIPRLDA